MNPGRVVLLGVLLGGGAWALAAPAAARPEASTPGPLAPPSHVTDLNISKAACGLGGIVTKAAGVACGGLANGGALLSGGPGTLGAAPSTLLGGGVGTGIASATINLGLTAIGASVVGAAAAVLHETAAALGATTTPQLESTWFSATYWRMAAIATMLTLPFLFAATVQAALRSDVALLARAALGYLPLAILSIAIAAPLTTMLLAASDELCGLISAAAANQSAHVLAYAAGLVAGLTAVGRSPFLAVVIGLLAIAAAFALWIELLLREAAVYVVVLMLPLAFAALAWPARRIWAVRAVEILIALILSKFAIVAVLSLGGAAIAASVRHAGVSGLMAGTVLIMLSALSPWALLRFVPLTEMVTGAAGALRGELRSAGTVADKAVANARSAADDWMSRTTSGMKRDAELGMADAGDPVPPGTGRGSDGSAGSRAGTGSDGPAGAHARAGAAGADGVAARAPAAPAASTPHGTTVGGPAAPAASTPDGTTVGDPAAPAASTPDDTTVGDPTPPAANRPGARTAGDPTAGGEPPAPPSRPWSQRPVLELGPNFGDTVVWPHEDAE